MAYEHTVTEQDMDAAAQQFVQGLTGDVAGREPDLSVDGLSGSILSWIFGLFGGGKI